MRARLTFFDRFVDWVTFGRYGVVHDRRRDIVTDISLDLAEAGYPCFVDMDRRNEVTVQFLAVTPDQDEMENTVNPLVTDVLRENWFTVEEIS